MYDYVGVGEALMLSNSTSVYIRYAHTLIIFFATWSSPHNIRLLYKAFEALNAAQIDLSPYNRNWPNLYVTLAHAHHEQYRFYDNIDDQYTVCQYYEKALYHASLGTSGQFDLALECGNLDVALEMATAIDRPECWNRLAQQALKQGNHKVRV